jgi:hypothetical protein
MSAAARRRILVDKFCPLLDVVGTVNQKAVWVSLRIGKVQGPLLLVHKGRKKRVVRHDIHGWGGFG